MMQRMIHYSFSTTVALISGAQRYDKCVAAFAKNLKQVNPTVSIIGSVGQQHSKDFSTVFASSESLDNHEWKVKRRYNTYKQEEQDNIFMGYRTKTIYKAYKFAEKMAKDGVCKDFVQQNVSAIVTVGSYALANRIGKFLNEAYAAANKVKPFIALVDELNSERLVSDEKFFDFVYHNLSRPSLQDSGYWFPSLCIGYEGLYAAFRYLQKFKTDPNCDSFRFQRFSHEVNELVQKARRSFRAAKNISEDSYIVTIAFGQNAEQADFCYKTIGPGLKDFLSRSQISNIKRDFFKIFVLLPQDQKLADKVKELASKLSDEVNIEAIFIKNQEKYGALCASDFGLLHNGEITVEAAACQLPATVLDKMSNFQAYFTYLYNGHASPLNISTNYHGYHDLCGSLSAVPDKIATLMMDHFERPKLRFYLIKLYRNELQSILSKSGTNPELRVSESGLLTASKHLLERAANYERIEVKETVLKERIRKEVIQF